ncbi:hypothetical protein Phum_PHUM476140 [Pediculus humanus corporis]|uniref:Uncharacterized protein n=1 Tax=Pediculus humanus subsp. corporis TaxID=121224 RepID=E0VW95_PEDHC|nr:uncharacterized protein Phum_PHUM476140 [Pediculus humanus corporis]EEB17651.1 hypothetical protein Phum_PHUM476140 [Pediculus humanus corporis]
MNGRRLEKNKPRALLENKNTRGTQVNYRSHLGLVNENSRSKKKNVNDSYLTRDISPATRVVCLLYSSGGTRYKECIWAPVEPKRGWI